ncbi:TetR/AcrR family transcriptional regulator [Singulisphaera sp. PoT]|uniref:TetR/AcrR family transcriptional regulator n=1 Tax=Singulisphaera sp. PoT TaxID=3411797 RepID=UPI003BF53CDA
MTAKPTRVRNAEGTRRAVLDAAERLFAEKGYAGTSMRDISLASGCSQPLIHHHFGSKDALYSSVRARIIEEYVSRFPDADRVIEQPEHAGCEIASIVEFLRDNETLPRLVAWARLEGHHRMWPGDLELMQALIGRIRSAQGRGIIRDDIDAPSLGVMLVGLAVFWVENRDYYSDIFENGPDDGSYLNQAVALVGRGLSPRAHSGPGASKTPPNG